MPFTGLQTFGTYGATTGKYFCAIQKAIFVLKKYWWLTPSGIKGCGGKSIGHGNERKYSIFIYFPLSWHKGKQRSRLYKNFLKTKVLITGATKAVPGLVSILCFSILPRHSLIASFDKWFSPWVIKTLFLDGNFYNAAPNTLMAVFCSWRLCHFMTFLLFFLLAILS